MGLNQNQFQSLWPKLQPKIKQKWNKLTDEDLKQVNGKRDVLLNKIQTKLGINRDQAERELQQLERSLETAGAGVTGSNSNSPGFGTQNQKQQGGGKTTNGGYQQKGGSSNTGGYGQQQQHKNDQF